MTERFEYLKDYDIKDKRGGRFFYGTQKTCNLLNKQDRKINVLQGSLKRQKNRNCRLQRDFDRLYQHIVDMGLMTEDEIFKVVTNG